MFDANRFLSLLRYATILLAAGVFFLNSAGLAHSCSEKICNHEKTENVIVCKCACNHYVQISEVSSVPNDFQLTDNHNSIFPSDPLPDAEPTGIFRPPKHLV